MRKLLTLAGAVVVFLSFPSADARPPSEIDALAVSQGLAGGLQKDPPGPPGIHFVFGHGVLDAEFHPKSGGGDEYFEAVHGADSAIWTGHYLAAESYRYAVTRTDEAKRSVLAAFQAIEDLVDVTGQDLLARVILPQNDPRSAKILQDDKQNGIWPGTVRGESVYYMARTSRDQYAGAFFGLSVAYSMVDDDALRLRISALVVRMIDKLKRSGWFVGFNDDEAITKPRASVVTFLTHGYQIASILQVGKQVAPGRYEPLKLSVAFWLHMVYEGLNPYQSYYKFNLAYDHLFNLLRLEKSSFWRSLYGFSYSHLRAGTSSHGNAHFNMIDRAVRGPDSTRDAETVKLLSDFLDRDDRNTSMGLPIRRDFTVDHRDDPAVAKCKTVFPDPGSGKPLVVACKPLSVQQRINTDFLWQRSPHQLASFGSGTIESAGIDYALPYWMGRCYGVIPQDDGRAGNTPCASEEIPLPMVSDSELSRDRSPVLALSNVFDWLRLGWKIGTFAERFARAQSRAPALSKADLSQAELDDLEAPSRLGALGFLLKTCADLRTLQSDESLDSR